MLVVVLIGGERRVFLLVCGFSSWSCRVAVIGRERAPEDAFVRVERSIGRLVLILSFSDRLLSVRRLLFSVCSRQSHLLLGFTKFSLGATLPGR